MAAPLDLPTLQTARLVLEPLGPHHSAGMFRLWSQEAVCRHSGPAEDAAGRPIRLPARTPADSDGILDFFIRRAARGLGFRWAMLEGPQFVGAIGFNHLTPRAELAYHLHPDAWGRGLATEATEAALAWAAGRGDVLEAEAFIEPANTASIRLAERLAFRKAPEPMRYVRDLTASGSRAG